MSYLIHCCHLDIILLSAIYYFFPCPHSQFLFFFSFSYKISLLNFKLSLRLKGSNLFPWTKRQSILCYSSSSHMNPSLAPPTFTFRELNHRALESTPTTVGDQEPQVSPTLEHSSKVEERNVKTKKWFSLESMLLTFNVRKRRAS